MEVRAQLNGVRLAPRKVRAVAALLKKKNVLPALDQLDYVMKRPAPGLAKLIRSAVANAEHTYHMIPSNLYIKDLVVNEGIKLKRYMPRAQGRAAEIQKKTSHILVVLDEREPGLRHEHRPKTPAPAPESAPTAESGQLSRPSAEAKPEVKPAPKRGERELGKREGFFGNLKRRFFRRKAI